MPLRIFTVMKLRRKLAHTSTFRICIRKVTGQNCDWNADRLARSFSWFSSLFLSFRRVRGIIRGLGWRSGQGAGLLVGRSRVRFPVVSLDFLVTYSFRPYNGPGVDSAPSENEYQEYFLGVKAAHAWGWRPHHFHVPNVMKIWEPIPPGNLWATPGLLRDSFTFTFYLELHRDDSFTSFSCIKFSETSIWSN